MGKPRIATASFTGCFGCHMSLLDIDERILALVDLVDLDRSPLDDKKRFDGPVDIGLLEGGVSNADHVETLREFREHCRVLVSVGQCAVTGGVPSMRNAIPLRECLEEAFLNGPTVDGGVLPDDPDLPVLLDKVYPCREVVRVDYHLPGCPPSADALWAALTALLTGQEPDLGYDLIKYD